MYQKAIKGSKKIKLSLIPIITPRYTYSGTVLDGFMLISVGYFMNQCSSYLLLK